MVEIRQVMWLVMLESAKNHVIGVDTPGQQVLPRVWYGIVCLLIRDVVGSVPCSNEWKFSVVTRPGSHGARGVMVPRLPREILALLWYCDNLS
jgi:cytosine/uracil/thiamine/allantoin permease